MTDPLAYAYAMQLPPWHLRDDNGRVWRVVPVYVDPDRTRELFALVPAEDTDGSA